MDTANEHIIDFAVALNERREKLQKLRIGFERLGYESRLSLQLAGTPFKIHRPTVVEEYLLVAYFDLELRAKTDEEASLTISILWDGTKWLIYTAVSVEAETGGMQELQSHPERQAETWAECIAQIDAAINDLFASQDLLLNWLVSRK